MTRSLLLTLLAAAITSVTACGGADAGDAQRPEAPAAAATAQPAGDADADAELAEIAAYRLSMPAVERWYQAQRNVYEAMRADPSIREQLERQDSDENEPTLDELEASYGAVPAVRQGIEAAGLEVRDFSVIALSLMQASLASVAMDMGASRDSVVASTGVSAANLEFVRENKAELDRLQAEVAALAPAESEGDDEGGA